MQEDFTSDQAARWVEQEFSKAITLSAAKERIASEEKFVRMMDTEMADMKAALPNSYLAHKMLVSRLLERLESEAGPSAPGMR